ncbi:MAG: hypothetical protein ACRC9R_07975 [Enterovibrio sp.]
MSQGSAVSGMAAGLQGARKGAMGRSPAIQVPRQAVPADGGRAQPLVYDAALRGAGQQYPNMERFPTVLPEGAQTPQYPNMEHFPVVRPDPRQRPQAPQQPLERLSPGVYRKADGSLVNQQGQRMPNQPERAPQGPQQQVPNPYWRDMIGGQYRQPLIQDGLGQYRGSESGPFNAPWQGSPGMYQPPPQNVSIGHGMHMPIPQPGVPYPNAGDPMWQQANSYQQAQNNAAQAMQQGPMIGNKPGYLTPQQQGPMNQAVQGFQPGVSGAAANYYRR